MTDQPHEFERRALNEAIESTYKELIGTISSIETNLRFGRGAEIDLHESFYFYMSLIYRLTCNEDEMINNAASVITKMKEWLKTEPKRDNDMKIHIMGGISIFEEYDRALHSCGIIVLPRRAR